MVVVSAVGFITLMAILLYVPVSSLFFSFFLVSLLNIPCICGFTTSMAINSAMGFYIRLLITVRGAKNAVIVAVGDG